MATAVDLRKKAADLRKLAREAERLAGKPIRDPEETRAADRARKKADRAAGRSIVVAKPEDPKRRKRLEKNVKRWLRFYLADIFTEPFRSHHEEMIASILSVATYGGDQAIAAPRGEAKTTLAECVSVFAILTGLLNFIIIFAATGRDARASLKSIKEYLAEHDALAADYPEVCLPIREAQHTPQLAHTMLVSGDGYDLHPAGFQWSGDEITFPRVPGSVSAGAIIATRGLDSAVRGAKKGRFRPQLAIIDDPDTEKTALSPDQANKLAARIERAIAGLAPKGHKMGRVMLTTLQNQTCASAQFTDPTIKPSWNGRRFSFLLRPPEHIELWQEYVRRRRESMQLGDRFGRSSHRWYLADRKRMNCGVEVCNPRSFDGRRLKDGSRLQVSAIQRYYDFVADNGEEAALCELQNDPPKAGHNVLSLEPARIANKTNGLARGVVPLKCQYLTAMADVHDRLLYYLVAAWEPDFTGYVIDYGVWPEQPFRHFGLANCPHPLGAVYPTAGKEGAITAGLSHLSGRLLGREWMREDGAPMRIGRMLADCKYETDTVKAFCRRSDFAATLMPSQGFYIRPGREWANYFSTKPGGQTGFHWRIPPITEGVRYVLHDADFWKTLAAERFQVTLGDAGCWSLYGNEPREHALLAEHCTAEKPEWRQPQGSEIGKWHWVLPSSHVDNHLWDCLIGAAMAASMLGVTIPGMEAVRPVVKRVSLAEMAASARRAG